VYYLAKWPGGIGNSLEVSVCDSSNAFSSNLALIDNSNTWLGTTFSIAIGANTGVLQVANSSGGANSTSNTFAANVVSGLIIGDNLLVGNATIGTQFLSISGISNAVTNATGSYVTINFSSSYRLAYATALTSNNVLQRYWQYANVIGVAPGQSAWVTQNGNTAANDEMHIVIVDNLGKFTGTPGAILEQYKGVSRATDALKADFTSNWYVNVLNKVSQYVWWGSDRSGASSANAMLVASSTNQVPFTQNFVLGTDGYAEGTVPLGILASGYQLFANKQSVDVDIILQGKAVGGTTVSNGLTVSNYNLANWITGNLLLQRLDCVGVFSPDISVVVNNAGYEASTLVAWRAILQSSSYGVMDSGYKYQYDRYNDVYRWIPLNGDVAGLMARTDATNAAWWSPAGFNRGEINNVVKLAYNPSLADRNILYPNGINLQQPGNDPVRRQDASGQAFCVRSYQRSSSLHHPREGHRYGRSVHAVRVQRLVHPEPVRQPGDTVSSRGEGSPWHHGLLGRVRRNEQHPAGC
jgi:hypothetical protein